ncbi:MAG: FixH family protein [Parvularcula sp.]
MAEPIEGGTPEKSNFIITGRHVLAGLVLFFGVIIAVNVVMARLAFKTFPGEQDEKPYYQGLHFNDTLAAREKQSRLGWHAEMISMPRSGVRSPVVIRILDKSGNGIDAKTVTGNLIRPTTDTGAVALEFEPIGDGRYQAFVDDMGPGSWELHFVVGEPEAAEFTAERRLWIE